jgi:hypothetical protein
VPLTPHFTFRTPYSTYISKNSILIFCNSVTVSLYFVYPISFCGSSLLLGVKLRSFHLYVTIYYVTVIFRRRYIGCKTLDIHTREDDPMLRKFVSLDRCHPPRVTTRDRRSTYGMSRSIVTSRILPRPV